MLTKLRSQHSTRPHSDKCHSDTAVLVATMTFLHVSCRILPSVRETDKRLCHNRDQLRVPSWLGNAKRRASSRRHKRNFHHERHVKMLFHVLQDKHT